MANLSDIIQGLIDTDSGVISKLKNNINSLSDKISRGSGSYALVDINTPDRGGNGVLENDLAASHGQCIALTTTSTSQCIYKGTFPESMKYGHYALCVRAKSNSTTSSNILQVKILNGSTVVHTINFKGSDLGSTTQYAYLYTAFTYEGANNTAKNNLSFELHTLTASGIKISFDYAYISMIIPSIFL